VRWIGCRANTCDLPSAIYDLPFLSEQAKRNILGLNAARIFGLDPTPRKAL
jgi:uncharacterized protein